MSGIASSGELSSGYLKSDRSDWFRTITHQDVLCTSADCPIFYRRTARQKEVEAAVSVMERFHNEQGW
jgi:hypothetical protein